MAFNKKTFFAVAKPIFKTYTQEQVDGINAILDYWKKHYRKKDLRFLGYALATTTWETARTMQPIKEYGGEVYLKSKPYYPYYGRGLVQITWEANYEKMQAILKQMGIEVQLVKNPDLALKWEYALPILFEGMMNGVSRDGDFTGKALEDYFYVKPKPVSDPVGARRIVNGQDKALTIAAIYHEWMDAFDAALTI